MTSLSLKECVCLACTSNFTLPLEEVDLWSFVEMKVVASIDVVLLVEQTKKWIILDSMKDNFIPYIVENKMAKEMYDALITLY